jgi:hypothetical protein
MRGLLIVSFFAFMVIAAGCGLPLFPATAVAMFASLGLVAWAEFFKTGGTYPRDWRTKK